MRPFFAPYELLDGRFRDFLPLFPWSTQQRVGVAGEPNTTEPSKGVTSLYSRGRGTKDLSASFSSSLCSRIHQRKETRLVTPPLLWSTTQRRGRTRVTFPPRPGGPNPSPWPGPGEIKVRPFFAPYELLDGRFRDFLPLFPLPPSRRFRAGGLLLCSGSSVLKNLGVEF